uniref:Uncharacterized protein n=1 Tax=Myoviridae sp. ctZ2t4 TaxID=2827693 RepID=A0A8S5STB8_9CAUD|nr:MAG TPA: hypothetical protein [Myoviridae sp. ctZ2t4]
MKFFSRYATLYLFVGSIPFGSYLVVRLNNFFYFLYFHSPIIIDSKIYHRI